MDGSVLDDSRPLPPVLSDITYQGTPVMEEKREKHNFTLSHLLTLPSLSFSTLPSLTSQQTGSSNVISLVHTFACFVVFFSAVIFSPSNWVTLCFKAALPHQRARLIRVFVCQTMLTLYSMSEQSHFGTLEIASTHHVSICLSLCLCFISLSHHR